ncbi:MAG: ORF6N domain-containing protein [Acidocella sp.]|nr:ORF6N domain-containing protein [Acidocella sp.]
MADKNAAPPANQPPRIFRVRGVEVILDSDLTMALGLETKRLNERIDRNSDLVDERHCFHLTPEEFDALRSQSATSKPGRGGRQYPPRVFTDRGVARVTTFINTPESLRAADLITDTFLMVQRQVAAGQRQIAVQNAGQYHADKEAAEQGRDLRKKLTVALGRLLDTVIDIRTHQTVSETAKDLTAGVLENIRERLKEKGLENLKLEAETRRILAEAEKLAADVRRADAETEGIRLDNLTKRIAMVRQLFDLQRELEPAQLVQLLDNFETGRAIELDADGPKRLARPAGDQN